MKRLLRLVAVELFAISIFIFPTEPVFADDRPTEAVTEIQFVDGATGLAIQPEAITAKPNRAGGVARHFDKRHVAKSGRGSFLLEKGEHTMTANSPGYHSMSGPLQVQEKNPYQIRFVLDPIEVPRELKPETVEALHRDDATLFQGFISDEETGSPLSGVRVRSLPSGMESSSDARGFFRLQIPVQTPEQRAVAPANLIFDRPGFRDVERQYLELWPNGDWTYTIRMEKGGGRKILDERTRRRNSSHNEAPSESASETNTVVSPAVLGALTPQDDFVLSPQATAATNATVRVPRNIRVQEPTIVWYVSFNYYVKHVLPSEWISSWNTNSLNAGAIAVRGYAIDRFNNKASTSTSDICGSSDCQNFDPDDTAGSTDRATDYTEGYVMVNANGTIAGLEYSSENNSLGKPCGDGFTAPTGGCLYDPICVGKDRSGHGRGMCQYGSKRWGAGQNGYPVRDWLWILKHYYPTLTLIKGAVLVVGDDIKARTANDCDVRICDDGSITNGVNCTLLTTKSPGDLGVIIGGPVVVTNDGKGFTWYKVQWTDTDSTVGWSCENFLDRVFSVSTAPTGLAATAAGASQINLSWTDTSAVEAGFLVERAIASSGPWIQIADLATNTTAYSDLNLPLGSKWYYRVRTYNANGFSSYTSVANATTAGDPPTIAPVSDRTVAPGTLVTVTNVGSVSDSVQLITDFEAFQGESANGLVLFRNPTFSSSTTNFLDKAPECDITAIMDTYPTGGAASGNVAMARFQVTNATNPWLRLTTAGTATYPNPVISFTNKLRFDIYTDKTIKIAVGCRETTNAVGTAIGSDGGTNGAIEWAGATNVLGTGPAPNRAIAASNWTTVTFNFTNEPIRNFSGGNGVLSTTSGLGVLEHLAIVPTAGTNLYNIYLDNFSVLFPRTLIYSLGAGAPTNATVNSTNGIFSWTPLISQAPSTNVIAVIATDNSVPALKATNTFTVFVSDAPIVITNQPVSVTTNVGSNVTFTVGASGTSLKYQWRFNATNTLASKTNASLTISNVQITNIGSYSVVVSNASFSVTSSSAGLTVMAPIIVSSAPASRTNNIGDNAFFSVAATGTNLTYQWRFNGSDLSSKTTSAINIAVDGTTNAGTYSVVLSSPYATSVTNSANLSIPYGNLLKLSQWNFNSQTPDTDVTTGRVSPSTGAGTATIIGGATNRFGSGSYSDIASLGLDNSSFVITNFPATNAANKTSGLQISVSTLGYQNIAVTWEQSNDAQSSRYARLQYTTNGIDWTDGNVIANATFSGFIFGSSDLTEVSAINNNTNFALRIVTEWESTATGSGLAAYVPANPGSTYSSNAVIRFDMLSVLGLVAPPTITSQPQSITRATGQSAVFTVAATGVNLAYQWKKEGVDLLDSGNVSGAQTASLTLASVNVSDAGNFTVAVTSGGGIYTEISDVAVLTVLPGNRYWSGDGISYGGGGTWNITSNQWSLSSGGPFNLLWNNANSDIALFGGSLGTVTLGTPVTANQLVFETGGYTLSGTNAITFSGINAGVNNPGLNNTSTTNLVTVNCPLAGPIFVKTGGGRLSMNNSANAVDKWVVTQGAITAATGNSPNVLFGSSPSQLVADFVTLDGGGLGFGASGSMTVGADRGIYLGTNGGKIGNNGTGGIITIDGPISGPGDLHFPGVTEWPGQKQGDNATFVISNTNNSYAGQTRIATAEVRLGDNQVFPATTTLNITNGTINGRLNLNGFNQTVAKVILDSASGSSRIFDTVGTGSLSAGEFAMRRTGYATGPSVTAVLAGNGFMTKTTTGNVTLGAVNTYTGDTIVSDGTLSIDAIGTFGSGAGTLRLEGGNIILTQTRTTNSVLLNPVLMTTNATIQNGDTTTGTIQFLHNGPWTTTGGTLTVRNTTSGSGGLFDLVLANAFSFTQPIVIGLVGEKACQLTSYNISGLTHTISGVISGPGTLRRSVVADGVSVGGRTVLTASNTYSGGTIVDAGMLVANNASGSATGPSNVTVTAVGQLAGTGTISGNVVVSSGTVSAGDGIGILTLQNGLNLSSGGTNLWELTAYADDSTGVAGADFDQLSLTGGQLQLGGSSKLMLGFLGTTTPNDFDSFWRVNHSWKIVSLSGGSNPGSTTFASIVNGTYNCGTFTTLADGSGNIILNFTTSFAGVLWWSGNGSTLGGVGTWDTINARFGLTNASPFSVVWNNALTNSAIFAGSGATPGNVTNNAAITVNKITVTNSSSAAYVFAGTNTLTFSGAGAGVFVQGANNSNTTTNNVTFNAKLAGTVLTKTGGGRMNMNNTNNTIAKWVVKEGAINGGSADALFGTGIPATLVTDFVTLDGGGLGFGASGAMTVGTNRGIYLGTGGGKIGNNGTGGIITINAPISGPGDLHFPGVTEWPGQQQGDNCTYIISNTNNSYLGQTRIATAEVRLGANQVFPATTTLNITNGAINGRLNLNGFNQTVAKVILDSTTGNSRIVDYAGGGSLSAGQFELRRSAVTSEPSVSAVLAGSGFLTKTSPGNVTLSATNTYTGDTIISEGTITIDGFGRFGSGTGALNLAGGGIILSTNRTMAYAMMNPLLLTADSTLNNGNTGTGVIQFPYGGVWGGTAGTLTIRNTTSTGVGSFDVAPSNGFTFTQPIVIGLAGDKPCQLTSFNSSSAISDQIYAGSISGIGTFRRSVSTGTGGRTIFTADNTYSGVTTIDSGTLVVNNPGPGSGTGTNVVTVNTNGILSGSGTIGGNVIVNGGATISAGDLLGVLTLQNGLTLTNAGTNVWDMAAAKDDTNGVAGVDFDQLVVTGGQLKLGGSSKLLIQFSGGVASPSIADPFWRLSHNWTIIRLNGGQNTNNAKFTTIINPTNSAGYFSTSLNGGSVILSYKSFATNELFWSGDGSTLGGIGTWNTTSNRWANSADGPFSQAWNNASGKGAIFDAVGGSVTLGANITVKNMTVGVTGYSIDGTNTLTFSGTGAGVDYPITTSGDLNKLGVNCPIAGSLLTKTAAGRLHLTSTNNTVSKWAIKGGIISVASVSRFGAAPGSLVSDFITLDGGGIGFDGTTPTLDATRGVTLGTNSGNKMGVRSTGVTLTLAAPLTGPGGISFPGYSSFPTLIHGGGGTFVMNNTNNNYLGATAVGTGTLKLGAAGVLPNGTTLSLTGSGKLDLNGMSETIASLVLDGGSASVIGAGALTVTNGYDVRRSGDVTAVLGGGSALTKTTTNTATLSGANTYSGGTTVSEGVLLINNLTGSGTGTGSVTVGAPAGILGGTGIVGGNVSVNPGGSVSPGNGVGILTLTNGLNLTNSGNLIWELGALKDNVDGINGVDFDLLAITGGQLRLNTNSTLTIQFVGTATAPDSTLPFWQVNHTWKAIVLSGSATNVGNQTFTNLVYPTTDAGSFSNYVSGTNLMLTFLAGVFGPQSIAEPPHAAARLVWDGTTPGVNITWGAIPGNRYEVQITSDLGHPNWQTLREIIAEAASISVTDFPSAGESQRYYRLLAK